MTSAMNLMVAGAHRDELMHRSEQWQLTPPSAATVELPGIELRFARADDGAAIARLAALDDAAELQGEILLALIDGEAVAGLALQDRRVIANPFVRTSAAIELLHRRAEQLSPARARRRIRISLRPRFA